MANGNKGYGGPRRPSRETRISPSDEREHTSERRSGWSDETRMGVEGQQLEDEELEDDEPESPPEPESGRTMFATHAALLAERLQDQFAKKIYGRNPNRVLRVDEPEGVSTAGGRLARQSLSLIPRKGQGPSVVCGWVDVSKKEAQLRGHESMSRRFEAHHGTPLDLSQKDYERCIDDLVEALASAGIKVRVLIPEEASAAQVPKPPPEPRGAGIPPFLILFLSTATFILGLFIGRLSR